ncbi:MAG: hypothetical protein ACM3TR_08120, partial [Caulobacteraceae bacterium]
MRDVGIDGISLIQSDECWKCSLQSVDKLVRELTESCGKDFLIGVHMNIPEEYSTLPDMGACMESAKDLERAGVNYLVVSGENIELVGAINESRYTERNPGVAA